MLLKRENQELSLAGGDREISAKFNQWWRQALLCFLRASQMALVVKNLPANAGGIIDVGLIPGSERSPGGGNGSPFQYSCLENPVNREAPVKNHSYTMVSIQNC